MKGGGLATLPLESLVLDLFALLLFWRSHAVFYFCVVLGVPPFGTLVLLADLRCNTFCNLLVYTVCSTQIRILIVFRAALAIHDRWLLACLTSASGLAIQEAWLLIAAPSKMSSTLAS